MPGLCYNTAGMSEIPVTSVTLLKAVSSDIQHPRWTELYAKYEGFMRTFLRARFPSLEHEWQDLMQETMIALTNKLPNYDYLPDDKGHFRNYLKGILNHKAQNALTRRMRAKKIRTALRNETNDAAMLPNGEKSGWNGETTDWRMPAMEIDEEAKWKKSAMEVAIKRLLSDESVNPFHRTVFRHVALLHENPEAVAEKFGTSRANVDVIKNRMIKRLKCLLTDS